MSICTVGSVICAFADAGTCVIIRHGCALVHVVPFGDLKVSRKINDWSTHLRFNLPVLQEKLRNLGLRLGKAPYTVLTFEKPHMHFDVMCFMCSNAYFCLGHSFLCLHT